MSVSDPAPLNIRDEGPGDAAAVAAVIAAAFRPDGGAPPPEAGLVDALRAAGALSLSLLAEDAGGRPVGHIAFSPVSLVAPGVAALSGRLLGLAPLAVVPACQRQGVGAALVEAGLARLRQDGTALVVVLGDPAYYRRFGFRPAAEFGLACEYDVPPEAFMALARDLPEAGPAVVRYHPAFARFEE